LHLALFPYTLRKKKEDTKMAKVMFGSLATDVRGKIAGIVYSKNRNGAYVRQKVSPTQSPTTRRTAVRERLAGLAAYFSGTLTAAQVAAWNAFAQNNPVTDIFGRTMILSGIQSFVQLNGIILNCGGAQIDDPPANLAITPLTSFTATLTAGAPDVASIAFAPTPTGANVKLQVYATQPLPSGRSFTKNFKRWLVVSALNAATPANIATAYLAKFGAMTAGNKIGIWVNRVDTTTGAQTPGMYDLVTIG
jgi:hypothetical protein